MLGQDSLFYWKGPQTTLLIERFQKVCPVKYVMPCSSGTAALHIAVAAAGIGPGDEVITSPITDIGTVIGVIRTGEHTSELQSQSNLVRPSLVKKKNLAGTQPNGGQIEHLRAPYARRLGVRRGRRG